MQKKKKGHITIVVIADKSAMQAIRRQAKRRHTRIPR